MSGKLPKAATPSRVPPPSGLLARTPPPKLANKSAAPAIGRTPPPGAVAGSASKTTPRRPSATPTAATTPSRTAPSTPVMASLAPTPLHGPVEPSPTVGYKTPTSAAPTTTQKQRSSCRAVRVAASAAPDVSIPLSPAVLRLRHHLHLCREAALWRASASQRYGAFVVQDLAMCKSDEVERSAVLSTLCRRCHCFLVAGVTSEFCTSSSVTTARRAIRAQKRTREGEEARDVKERRLQGVPTDADADADADAD
eukprot:PhM_4_TR12932/c1_g1_i2/m.25464